MARVFPNQLSNVIDNPVYDTISIPAAATTLATFFQTPQGAGTSAYGAVAKHLADTNMTIAGSLPSPQALLVRAIMVSVAPNVTLADMILLLRSGAFELTVGSKPFLQCPIEWLPAGLGMFTGGSATTVAATTITTTNNGVPDTRSCRVLTEPIPIGTNENFNARLTWPVAITLGAATPVKVYLAGDFFRSVQ